MCLQTEGNDDRCGMIGSLFDESAVGTAGAEAEPVAWSDDDTPGMCPTCVISWLHCMTVYVSIALQHCGRLLHACSSLTLLTRKLVHI